MSPPSWASIPLDQLRRATRAGRRRLQAVRMWRMPDAQLERLVDDLAAIPEVADMDLRHAVAWIQKRGDLPVTGYPDEATRLEVARWALAAQASQGGPTDPGSNRWGDMPRDAQVLALHGQVEALEAQLRVVMRIAGSEVMLPPVDPSPDRRRVVSWMAVPGPSGARPVRVAFDGTTTQYVLRRLAEDGVRDYEPATVATVLAATELMGGGFHDVGANIGVFALLVKSLLPDADVTAFEPGSELARTCREIVALNGLDVEVQEVALAQRDGDAQFYMSPTDTSNSLREGFREAVDVVTVPVARLDTWLGHHPGHQPAVLKIDTESTEPDVLAGASDFIAQARPWLVVEVLKGRTEDRLEEWCAEVGYHRHHIGDDGPRARGVIEGDATYAHLNWLFTPTALPEAFWEPFTRWHDVLAGSVTISMGP